MKQFAKYLAGRPLGIASVACLVALYLAMALGFWKGETSRKAGTLAA